MLDYGLDAIHKSPLPLMSFPVKPLPADDLDHVLAHTRELWAEARGQTFFITGGTGFFGLWLLESFARANDALALGMKAVVLTRAPEAFGRKAPHLAARADLEWLRGDLASFAFPPGRFEHIIHAAADTGIWTEKRDVDEVIATFVAGTRRVLDFAAGAGVKNLLLVSSGAVYGRQPAGLTHVPEDYAGAPDPLLPESAWGEGKRVAEHLCAVHAMRHGYAVKVARCFAFVGPHLPLDANYAIGNFLRDAGRGQPIRVRGDGTPRRSYLYAADLAIWLWTILFRAPGARAYNVGSDVDRTIVEHARCVSAAYGGHAPVLIEQQPDPARAVSRYVPAIGRAGAELGLRVWIGQEEAIRRTMRWLDPAPGVQAGDARFDEDTHSS